MKILLSILSLILSLITDYSTAAVLCNSTAPGFEGVCTGDYCFNMENKIRGCVNFYRMIRDDNIACGFMPILGQQRKICICTQPFCGKYDVGNMPMQTLANVTCTDDTNPTGRCTPGPCYVGNDMSDKPLRTCAQDWFAVTSFNQLGIYEVPPLANHPTCFFQGDKFNCMCKDPGCNANPSAPVPPANASTYYACHKMQCRVDGDPTCTEESLGNETCVGQMCYFGKNHYDFVFENTTYKDVSFVKDCLNYSFAVNPVDDLTFATGVQFGEDSNGFFYPCVGDYCNAK